MNATALASKVSVLVPPAPTVRNTTHYESLALARSLVPNPQARWESCRRSRFRVIKRNCADGNKATRCKYHSLTASLRYIVTEPAGPTVTLATRATPPVRPRSGVAGGTLVGTAYSSERQSEGKPLGPSSSFADHAPAANAAVGASKRQPGWSN